MVKLNCPECNVDLEVNPQINSKYEVDKIECPECKILFGFPMLEDTKEDKK